MSRMYGERREREHTNTHTHTHGYLFILVLVAVKTLALLRRNFRKPLAVIPIRLHSCLPALLRLGFVYVTSTKRHTLVVPERDLKERDLKERKKQQERDN